MGIFENRQQNANGTTQIPVWFMRQAGRYHSHYQNIKKDFDFITMCKTPTLACQVTMGPMQEFDFDAAILFSDLLFPLEQLGLGLTYNPGPILKYKLQEAKQLKLIESARNYYLFQKEALQLIKAQLSPQHTLLGFVGAPFTLFAYACEGLHAGQLAQTKLGLRDGRYPSFIDILLPQLLECMCMQAEGGADGICLFDTAAGILTPSDFQEFIVPAVKQLTKSFKLRHPNTRLIYYSKETNLHHFERLEDDNIDVLGIDWRLDLRQMMTTLGNDYYIQGNIDPSWPLLPWPQLEKLLTNYWGQCRDLPLNKWICNLGHGVLPQTPQDNVKKIVQYIHNNFCYRE